MKKTLISCILVAAITLTSFCVFANDSTKSPKTDVRSFSLSEEQQSILNEKIKTDLGEMLESGDITQEQHDHMTQILEKGGIGFPGGRGGKMMELTDEQKAEMTKKLKENLASQLIEGKITQEEYDEKIKAIESGDFNSFGRGMKRGRKPMDESVNSSASEEGFQKNRPNRNMGGKNRMNSPFGKNSEN